MFKILTNISPVLIKSTRPIINAKPIIIQSNKQQSSPKTVLNELKSIYRLDRFNNLNIEIKRCGDEDDDYGSGNSNDGGFEGDKDDDILPSTPTPNSNLDPLNPSNPLSPLNPMHPMQDDDADSHRRNTNKNEPIAARFFNQTSSLHENILMLANQQIKFKP